MPMLRTRKMLRKLFKKHILYSSGMFYNPKACRQQIVDLKSKTLVASSKYGVQLTDVRYYKKYKISDKILGEGPTQESWDINKVEPATDNSLENLVATSVESLPDYGWCNYDEFRTSKF